MKKCSKCKILKDRSEFHKARTYFDGLCYYCKECNIKHSHNWFLKNKERARASRREYAKNNPRKIGLYWQTWNQNNRERRREISRESAKRRYWEKKNLNQ